MGRSRFGAALVAGLLAGGCSATQPDRSETSASVAQPCTVAGYASTNEVLPVDLSHSGLSCGPALTILHAYLALPDDGQHGNTKAYEVDGWSCQSPTAAMSEQTNTVTVCAKGDHEIVVRPGPAT
ncbi:MAG: hypothetical protein ACXVXP_02305 [Mycobacteriaceae bacterium]